MLQLLTCTSCRGVLIWEKFVEVHQNYEDTLSNKLTPDNIDHFVGFRNEAEKITQFGFEDQTNGRDRDYDDLVYNITSVLQPSPPVEGRSIIFIKSIDSIGKCGGRAEQWVMDYLESMEGTSLFGRANISRIINFSYAGNSDGYSCPETEEADTELVYTAADTCDGVAHASTELKALIEQENTSDKTTIVAHSMGGLVTAFLVATQSEWSKENIASVITFDSPLRGVSEIATWAKRLKTACQFEFDPFTNQSSLSDLADVSNFGISRNNRAVLCP